MILLQGRKRTELKTDTVTLLSVKGKALGHSDTYCRFLLCTCTVMALFKRDRTVAESAHKSHMTFSIWSTEGVLSLLEHSAACNSNDLKEEFSLLSQAASLTVAPQS